MLTTTRQVSVWACAEPVSMRFSFDGLFAVARQSLGRDPLMGDMYLFVAANRKQARVLYFDGTGLVVVAKRLEVGKFNAPWEEGERERPWRLTEPELALFLQGSPLAGRFELSPPPLVLGRK